MNPYANAIARAAAAAPMAAEPITPGRTLLVDGDGLAYYCAGNDDTSTGEARERLVNKVLAAQNRVGAEKVMVLLTASGSHKGHRYAIARVKPYQGQRSNSKRPKNWEHLRDFMLSDRLPFHVWSTELAEADDLFGWHCYNFPDTSVILTQDKDMRMLPGLHLDWVSNALHKVDYTESQYVSKFVYPRVVPIDSVANDKQYGHKWFWLQMLHGDTADNIPGLPKYQARLGVFKPVGEVTANTLIKTAPNYVDSVVGAYISYYGERWLVEMLEQACLLWMRRIPEDWDDCTQEGGAMAWATTLPEYEAAYTEIEQRVRQADDINAAAKSI